MRSKGGSIQWKFYSKANAESAPAPELYYSQTYLIRPLS